MRPSLLPGLIAAAQRNFNHGATSVRLFEVGRRYLADTEHPTVGLLLSGDRTPRDWQTGKAQDFTAFDAKAEVAGAARGGRRAGRQPADLPGRRPDLASGPLGDASAWAEDHRRGLRRNSPAPGARA